MHSVKYILISLLSVCLFSFPALAEGASADKTTFDIGGRLQVLGTFDDNGNNFDLNDARVHVGATRGIFVGAIQLAYDGSDLYLKDGFTTASFNEYAKVKAGRFKMPTGRNTEQTTYDSITWYKNTVASDWLSPERDNRGDGIAVSGSVAAGKDAAVTYNLGVFDSGDYNAGAIYAGRGTIAFDGAPGLNIGLTIQSEEDAKGPGKDFFGIGVDATYAIALKGAGDVIVNGGWNDYDLDGATYFPGTGLNAGDGFYVETAITLEETATVASIPVQFQPFFKYQSFDYEGLGSKQERWDVGVNFLLDGVFDATKLTVNFFTDDPVVCCNNDGVLLGVKTSF
ncbi:MAG: hypothetical protein GY751_26090 [Bacteroidetes bacterium]|nr:hypothetical protein [Bacteroidota bacterium]